MATTRATGREPNPVDDEFLHHLYRGGELLAAGKVIEAKDFLERAHKMQPKNEKGQNLLGLTYFKLGLFDRAAELYEMLVADNPVDPTLRVNLGLVYLKTNALQRAVREFEVAVDLAPDHKKAHNYLGLALAQQGEYGRAREHFLQSGSDAMAEKMTRAIAGEGFSRPPPVQPAKERGFAELEGTEVVREQGGVPVPEAASQPPGSELMIDVVEETPAQPAAPVQAMPPPLPEAEEEVQLTTPPPLPEAEEVQLTTPPPLPPSEEVPLRPPPLPRAAPVEAAPAAEDDWGAQFGLDESAQQGEAPTQEAAPEAPTREAVPEVPAPVEEPDAGAEGPVVATSNASAQAEDIIISEEEASNVPAQLGPMAPETSDDNLPVLPVEEVSEDGMPVLTAEPENAEDLAAISQHEQAPAEGAREAPPPPPVEAAADDASAAGTPAELETPEPEAALPVMEAGEAVQEAQSAEAPPATQLVSEAPALEPRPAVPAPTGRGFWQEGQVPILGELAPTLTLMGAEAASPFSVGEGGFSARVDGELLTRLEGLVALTGQLSFKVEMKRFRGRTTDKPFGEGSARMVRASGRGVLFIEPAEKHTFQAVDLGDESAYFRDECVFAFEEPVMFENGRVPSDMEADLDLVHLRGNGKVLLSIAGPLRSIPVGMEAAVTVPMTHLVGWQGNLTPRVVALVQGAGGEVLKTAVELSGEGFALICLPVR